MSIEKTFEKFNVSKRTFLGTEQVAVECFVSTENLEPALSVLSTYVKSQVDSVEKNTSDVAVNGKIYTNIIYLVEGNMLQTANAVCPFTVKLNAVATGEIYAKSKVIENNVSDVSANGVKVVSIVEVEIYEIVNVEQSSFSGAGENVCTKEMPLQVCSYVGSATDKFTNAANIMTKEKVKTILCVESGVSVKDFASGYNFASVSGETITRVVYSVDDGREKLLSAYVSVPFKEEIELTNATKESTLEVLANVDYENVKVIFDEKDNETIIKIDTPVDVKVFAFECKEINAVTDLYSTTNFVQTTTESFEMDKPIACDYFESKIEGNLTLNENVLRVDKVLAVTGAGLTESGCYVMEGEVVVEGVSFANIIYLNDETGTINSAEVEFPFVVKERCDNQNAYVGACVALTDVDIMVKKGRDVFFDAKLKLQICYYGKENGALISDITLTDEIPPRDAPIEIYFAKEGDTLWDIAKFLKVSDITLLTQNPELTDPLDKDEKIILYGQKLPKTSN